MPLWPTGKVGRGRKGISCLAHPSPMGKMHPATLLSFLKGKVYSLLYLSACGCCISPLSDTILMTQHNELGVSCPRTERGKDSRWPPPRIYRCLEMKASRISGRTMESQLILTNISWVYNQHTVPLHHLQYHLSGNMEMSKPWSDGPIWSGFGAEAATRAKDSCHRRSRIQGKPGFHSLSWTYFFFQAVAIYRLMRDILLKGSGRRRNRKDNGAAGVTQGFWQPDNELGEFSSTKHPWSSKGSQEFEVKCQSTLSLFSFSSHYN